MDLNGMRDNLLSFGLAEQSGQGIKNFVNLIEDFCETKMGIEGIGNSIERAHRVGKINGSARSLRAVDPY